MKFEIDVITSIVINAEGLIGDATFEDHRSKSLFKPNSFFIR
jgi:hypothetical protein